MNRLTFCLLQAFLLDRLIVTNSCGKKGLQRSTKTTSSLWFGSLLARDNKQLVFRKNVFQCLYTLCGSVHELSDFKKLVPSLKRKPFVYLFQESRSMQSHLKNLWPSTSRVKKIYIPVLLQSPNIEENRHLGKLILASEKTNSTVGFSIGPTSSPGLFPQKMIYWGKALGTNSHFQNEAKCKTFPLCETQRIKNHFPINSFPRSLALK